MGGKRGAPCLLVFGGKLLGAWLEASVLCSCGDSITLGWTPTPTTKYTGRKKYPFREASPAGTELPSDQGHPLHCLWEGM